MQLHRPKQRTVLLVLVAVCTRGSRKWPLRLWLLLRQLQAYLQGPADPCILARHVQPVGIRQQPLHDLGVLLLLLLLVMIRQQLLLMVLLLLLPLLRGICWFIPAQAQQGSLQDQWL
jgi:hypothetical protein